MGDQQSYEVWFVHWNNGPSEPSRRSGPFSYPKAEEYAAGLRGFNPKTEPKVIQYVPVVK